MNESFRPWLRERWRAEVVVSHRSWGIRLGEAADASQQLFRSEVRSGAAAYVTLESVAGEDFREKDRDCILMYLYILLRRYFRTIHDGFKCDVISDMLILEFAPCGVEGVCTIQVRGAPSQGWVKARSCRLSKGWGLCVDSSLGSGSSGLGLSPL